jgi:hypothetical protein
MWLQQILILFIVPGQGGCGYPTIGVLHIDQAPVAFALVLVWDTPPQQAESNEMVCALLPDQIDLGQAYNGEAVPSFSQFSHGYFHVGSPC